MDKCLFFCFGVVVLQKRFDSRGASTHNPYRIHTHTCYVIQCAAPKIKIQKEREKRSKQKIRQQQTTPMESQRYKNWMKKTREEKGKIHLNSEHFMRSFLVCGLFLVYVYEVAMLLWICDTNNKNHLKFLFNRECAGINGFSLKILQEQRPNKDIHGGSIFVQNFQWNFLCNWLLFRLAHETCVHCTSSIHFYRDVHLKSHLIVQNVLYIILIYIPYRI